MDSCTPLPEHLKIFGLSNTPAENVAAWGEWEDDRYLLRVRGSVREARLFGENLRLTRAITARLGDNCLTVEDVVVNHGFEPSPHMFLYHINLGFPVVSEKSRLVAPVRRTVPRDPASEAGVASYHLFSPPQANFKDQVFFHDLGADEHGLVHCGIIRRDPIPFGVALEFPREQLPCFTEWKMTGLGTYLAALEPGNCNVEGMRIEREKGRLQWLGPGESKRYRLTISVIASEEEADRFEETVSTCR